MKKILNLVFAFLWIIFLAFLIAHLHYTYTYGSLGIPDWFWKRLNILYGAKTPDDMLDVETLVILTIAFTLACLITTIGWFLYRVIKKRWLPMQQG